MKVEIWADIICPWCGLGSHRLDMAVEQFEHGDRLEVVHRSFQLDPSWPDGVTSPVAEMLSTRKGASPAQVREMTARVEGLAAADGLEPYVVLDNRVGNTSLAHELLAYASDQGRGSDAWKAMFGAYFGQTRDIFDSATLVDIGTNSIGLDETGVVEALTSRRFRHRVMADQVEAQRLGARGVPFIAVDRAYGVSGAQPVSHLLSVFEQAWAASKPTEDIASVPVGQG